MIIIMLFRVSQYQWRFLQHQIDYVLTVQLDVQKLFTEPKIRTTEGCNVVRFRRYKVPLVRPVRVVANKIETEPKFMSEIVEYHVEYKGEKYYIKKYDDNTFGSGSGK